MSPLKVSAFSTSPVSVKELKTISVVINYINIKRFFKEGRETMNVSSVSTSGLCPSLQDVEHCGTAAVQYMGGTDGSEHHFYVSYTQCLTEQSVLQRMLHLFKNKFITLRCLQAWD